MPEISKPGQIPLSSSLPLDATPNNSLALSTSLPAPQHGLSTSSQAGSAGLTENLIPACSQQNPPRMPAGSVCCMRAAMKGGVA